MTQKILSQPVAREVLLPELAESVIEGEILKWLVEEGAAVALEQPLVEVMTDKVTVELPSPYAGTLKRRLAKEGDVVAVHAAIALIEEGAGVAVPNAPTSSGEAAAEAAIQASAENPVQSADPRPVSAPEERSIVESGATEDAGDDLSLFKAFGEEEQIRLPSGMGAAPEAAPTPSSGGRVLAVPAARQLARELNIDLSTVRGSGPNGRIRVLDVHQHAAGSQAPAAPTAKSTGGGMTVPPVQYRTPKGHEHLEERTPLRGMRRAISNQMLASHLYTVRTLTVDEVNLSQLVALRERVRPDAAAAGVRLSYLPFIFKAVTVALRKYPSLNTSFDEATGEIVHKRYYHLGMAVATEAGLTVPVIRDVNQKSLFELAREIGDLGERAKAGGLRPDELAGSSFSVTNIGSIGALFSFPIINVPDAAILGVHSIVKRPIVNAQDEIEIGHMMYLSLSFDHRLVDGAEAARFCKEVIRLLEQPERLMLEAM